MIINTIATSSLEHGPLEMGDGLKIFILQVSVPCDSYLMIECKHMLMPWVWGLGRLKSLEPQFLQADWKHGS